MRLLTLGRLSLQDASFGRTKPLLLLTYLALEGPQERRHLAELFWSGASDPMNSLSAALTKLRKGLEDAVEADEVRAWTSVQTDAAELVAALESADLDAALELYQGPFLHGTRLPDWSIELEEWVYGKREELAGRVQRNLLKLAESQAAQADFERASHTAEAAYTLGGAEFEPEELTRLYFILKAGDNPLIPQLREEAQGFDIALTLSRDEARARLQRVLVGRQRATARLAGLAPGEWAWVRGGAGMGKTALLKSLSGTFLYGRSGLPYATLEPLVGATLQEGKAAILQHLLRLDGRWHFDNWDNIDEQSKEVLTRLKNLRPRASVVISSREPAPFSVEVLLELGLISKDAVEPEVWQKTHGLPALVEAYLRNEPLESALETRLAALTKDACNVYLALALLDEPDIALVRRALGLKAPVTANVLEELLAAGFVEPAGQVRVRQAAQEYLEARPVQLGKLSLHLARQLGGTAAFTLYSQAKVLWEEADLPGVKEAYLAWANELLRRGFPQRASETLADAPEGEEVTFLQARALERSELFREALEALEGVKELPEALALKGALYWRLGNPTKAKEASEKALKGDEETLGGDIEARAEALNTLGHLTKSASNLEEAKAFYQRAAAIWKSIGRKTRWVDALSNAALLATDLGEDTEHIFQEALAAAEGNPKLSARMLLNLGWLNERLDNFAKAESIYKEAAELSRESGTVVTTARIWNNLGVLYHRQNRSEAAGEAYGRGLKFAQQAGERRVMGLLTANLAELTENLDAWQEALHMLEESGHQDAAENCRKSLSANHPFRELTNPYP